MNLVSAPSPPSTAPTVLALPVHEYPAQDTSWGVWQVRAPAAWVLNKGHSSFITVIDQGVDNDHALSSGGDALYNLTECWSSSSNCWPDTNDSDGHGSHVFGIAAARNNAVGGIGIAPLPAGGASHKVCGPLGCSEAAIVGALDWVTSSGKSRHIVVMPFTSLQAPSMEWVAAIANAYNAGALLIASAGNTPLFSSVGYPASDSRVMAVSGTLEGDVFATSYYCDATIGSSMTGGSVTGSAVEIAAPFWAVSMWSHLRYNKSCGTSMAAPVVAGVAALIWTHWPTWSAAQVRSRLTGTAKDLGPSGRDAQFGWGRVDAQDALFNFAASVFGLVVVSDPGTYQWNALTSPTGVGTGLYTYQWAVSYNGTTWSNVGTSQSYSRYVGPTHPNFHLRVTITSSGYVKSKSIYVQNYSGGCNPC
jgi:subtilisin family serine protease